MQWGSFRSNKGSATKRRFGSECIFLTGRDCGKSVVVGRGRMGTLFIFSHGSESERGEGWVWCFSPLFLFVSKEWDRLYWQYWRWVCGSPVSQLCTKHTLLWDHDSSDLLLSLSLFFVIPILIYPLYFFQSLLLVLMQIYEPMNTIMATIFRSLIVKLNYKVFNADVSLFFQ